MSEYRPFRGRGRGRGGFQHGNNFRASMPNNFNDMRMPNPNFGAGPHFSRNDNKNPRWQRPPHSSVSWRSSRFKSSFSPNRPPYMNTFSVLKNSPPNIKLPSVPLPGSEEARQKNIAEASARIKEQLELAESNGGFDAPLAKTMPDDFDDLGDCIIISSSPIEDLSPRPKTPDKKKKAKKSANSNPSQSGHQTPASCSSVEELNKKILTQFTFMSKGKIQNLVNNPGSTKYDVALQHLIRDMKLNLSCELRTLYNNRESEQSNNENTMIDHFNSLVPDLGVELVSLPDTMVAELSKMLQLDENNELETLGTDPVENILVEPEDMFKQAQELLTNSQFLDDALQKSPAENSTAVATDPFDRRSPIFNCPPPNFNLPPPTLNLNLNNISQLDQFSPNISSPTESQINALSSATPRLETMTQQIEQIEKDLDIPVPESANEISDTLKANLPNLFCQHSPLFRAADPSPFSKKLLEEFEEIAIRPVSSEPFTHLLNPILPSPPKTADETNVAIDIRPNVTPEQKKPNNGAKLFDFDSVWITKQPGGVVSSNTKQQQQQNFTPETVPKIDTNTTQLNVTSFLQDVTYNDILNFDDCTTSSGKNDSRRRSTSRTSSHSPFYDSSRNSNSSFPEDATSPAKRIPLDERIKQMMKMQDKGERKGKEGKEKDKKQFSSKLKKKIKSKKLKKALPLRDPPQEEAKRRVLLTEKPLNILKCTVGPEPVKGPLVFKKFGEQNNVKKDFVTKKIMLPPVVIKTEVISLDDESSNEKHIAAEVPKCSKEAARTIETQTEKSPEKPIKGSTEKPTTEEVDQKTDASLPKNDNTGVVPQEEEKSNWSDDNLDNVEPFSDLCPKTINIPSEVAQEQQAIETDAKDKNAKEETRIENIERLNTVEDKIENEEIKCAQEVPVKLPAQTELVKQTSNKDDVHINDEIAKNIAEIFDDTPAEILNNKTVESKVNDKQEIVKISSQQKEDCKETKTPDTNDKGDLLLDKNEKNRQEKIDDKSLENVTEKSHKIDKNDDLQEIKKIAQESKDKSQEKIEISTESQSKSHESRAKSQEKIEKAAKSHEHRSLSHENRAKSNEKKHHEKSESKDSKKAHDSKESKSHESRGRSSDNKKEKSSSHHSKARSNAHHKHHSSSSKSTSHSAKSDTHSVKESWSAKPNQEILNRLFDIDMQINKLMQEKWDLYQVLNTNKINNIASAPAESFAAREATIRPMSVPASESSVISDTSGSNKPLPISNADASTNTMAVTSKTVDSTLNTDEALRAVSLKRKAIHTQTYSDIEPSIFKKRKTERVDKETNTVPERLANSEIIKSVQYSSESDVDFSRFTSNKSHNTPLKKPTSPKKSPKTKKINKVQYSSDSEEEDGPVQRIIRRKRVTRKDTQHLMYSHSESESAPSGGPRAQTKAVPTSDSEPLTKIVQTGKQSKKIKKITQKEIKSNNKSIEETIDRVIENADSVQKYKESKHNEKKKNLYQTIEEANNSLALVDEELREVTQKQITLPKKAVLETVEGQNKQLSEIDDNNSDTEYYLRGFESQSNTPAKEEIAVVQATIIVNNPVVIEEPKKTNKQSKKKAKKSKRKSKRNLQKEEAMEKHTTEDETDNYPKKIRLETADEECKLQKRGRKTSDINKLDNERVESESESIMNRLTKINSDQKGVVNQIVNKSVPKNSSILDNDNIQTLNDEKTNQIDDNINQIDENVNQIDENTNQIDENTNQIDENTNQIDENPMKTSNVLDLRILNVFTLAPHENSESDFESVRNKDVLNELEENNALEGNAEPEAKEIEQSDDLESGANDNIIENPTEDVAIAQESPEDIIDIHETELTNKIDFIEAQKHENVVESLEKEAKNQELECQQTDKKVIIKKKATKGEVKQMPIKIIEEEYVKPHEAASESDSNKNIKKIITKAEMKLIPVNENERQDDQINKNNSKTISKNIMKIPTKGEVKKIPVEEESMETKENLESIAKNKRKRNTKMEPTKEVQVEKVQHEDLNVVIKNRNSRKRSNKDKDNEIESRESSVETNNRKNNATLNVKNMRKRPNKEVKKTREERVETQENERELEIEASSKNIRKKTGKDEVKKISDKEEEKDTTESDVESNRRKRRSKSQTRKIIKEIPEPEIVVKLHHEQIDSDLELNTRKRKRVTKSESRKIPPKDHLHESESDVDSNVKQLRKRITKSETRKLDNTDNESPFKNYSHVNNIESDSNDAKSISIRMKKREESDRNSRKRVSKHGRRKSVTRDVSEEKEVVVLKASNKMESDSDSTPKVTRKRLKKVDTMIKSSVKNSILGAMLKEIECPKSVSNKTKKTVSGRNRALRSSISSLGSNESINIPTEKQPEVNKPQHVENEDLALDDYCSDSSSKSKQIRGHKRASTTTKKMKNNMSPCFVRLRRITPERLSSFHSVSHIKQVEEAKPESLAVKDTEIISSHNEVEKICEAVLPIEEQKPEEPTPITPIVESDKKIESPTENVEPVKPVQEEIQDKEEAEKHIELVEDIVEPEKAEMEVQNIEEEEVIDKEKDSSFEPGKNQDHNVSEEIVSHQATLKKKEESVDKNKCEKESEEQLAGVLTNYVDPDSIYCKGHMKSILDIKVIGDEFLAASEDGTIYKYCCKTGALQDAYTGHKRAVTCLFVTNGSIINVDSNVMYTGSLDCTLKCYNIDTAEILHNVTVSQAIQCLDSSWGYIFLGTYEGLLFIYNIKKKYLNPQSLTIASSTVLMIKATQEGSRHILIVASRKREIMVRDAFTGLLLRTMCSEQSPTIYSLYLDQGSVYCGTSDKGIIIVEFNTGAQTGVYNSGKGVVCMVKYKQLLFAGCYDGFIYIYNTKMQKHVATIAGPGEGMVLSLVIYKGMIIAGNKKDHLLKIWKIPPSLLAEEKE